MNCDRCNQPTAIEIRERYHYTSCGLDNVYLRSVELRVCSECGAEVPRIPRISDLLARIGRSVALQNVPLRGVDLKFLRKQLGMRGSEWAKACKIDPATLSRCENNEQRMGPQTDLLTRYVYIRALEERERYRVADAIVDRLASVERLDDRVPLIVIDVQQNEADYLMGSSTVIEEGSQGISNDFAGRILFATKPLPRKGVTASVETVVEEAIALLPHSDGEGLVFSEDKPKYAAISLTA